MIRRRKPIARSATPIKRSALKRKPARKRAGADPGYLQWLRTRPCLLCPRGMQGGPIEAAHVGVRGLGQKCPDSQAVPLCAAHHRTGKQAQHLLGRKFWEFHNLDRDAEIGKLRELYGRERGILV